MEPRASRSKLTSSIIHNFPAFKQQFLLKLQLWDWSPGLVVIGGYSCYLKIMNSNPGTAYLMVRFSHLIGVEISQMFKNNKRKSVRDALASSFDTFDRYQKFISNDCQFLFN